MRGDSDTGHPMYFAFGLIPMGKISQECCQICKASFASIVSHRNMMAVRHFHDERPLRLSYTRASLDVELSRWASSLSRLARGERIK